MCVRVCEESVCTCVVCRQRKASFASRSAAKEEFILRSRNRPLCVRTYVRTINGNLTSFSHLLSLDKQKKKKKTQKNFYLPQRKENRGKSLLEVVDGFDCERRESGWPNPRSDPKTLTRPPSLSLSLSLSRKALSNRVMCHQLWLFQQILTSERAPAIQL